MNPRDLLVAKAILSALEHSGFRVFLDWRTGWHFDDKVAQKYLFEAIDAPFVPSWVYLDRRSAMDWVESATFPKVFKLRGGAGSSNVRPVRSRSEARRLVRRAFGSGIPNYDAWGSLKERWHKVRLGKVGLYEVAKGIARFLRPPPFARAPGRERGYVYFKEFMANNDSDTRVIVLEGKAFALKRFMRDNDFRASGSGHFAYAREEFDERCEHIAFDISDRLGTQCAACDFVFDGERAVAGEDELQFHQGRLRPLCRLLGPLASLARGTVQSAGVDDGSVGELDSSGQGSSATRCARSESFLHSLPMILPDAPRPHALD